MVGGTVTKLTGFRPTIYYFHTRNRIYTIIRYFYGKFLLSALLMNAIILLKHLLFGYAMRRRLVIRVLLNIIKKLGDNIGIRKNYTKALKERKVLERFIINILC